MLTRLLAAASLLPLLPAQAARRRDDPGTRRREGLGGKKVAAGSWHLTMARSKDGWNLVLSPAEADHRARIDGFGADSVQAAIEVPLTKTAATPAAAALQLAFVQQGAKTELVITFGPERFAVAIAPPKS